MFGWVLVACFGVPLPSSAFSRRLRDGPERLIQDVEAIELHAAGSSEALAWRRYILVKRAEGMAFSRQKTSLQEVLGLQGHSHPLHSSFCSCCLLWLAAQLRKEFHLEILPDCWLFKRPQAGVQIVFCLMV